MSSNGIAAFQGCVPVEPHTRARHIEQLPTFPLPATARPVPAEHISQTLNEYKQWLLNCSKNTTYKYNKRSHRVCFALYSGLVGTDVRLSSEVLGGELHP